MDTSDHGLGPLGNRLTSIKNALFVFVHFKLLLSVLGFQVYPQIKIRGLRSGCTANIICVYEIFSLFCVGNSLLKFVQAFRYARYIDADASIYFPLLQDIIYKQMLNITAPNYR